MQPSSIGGYLSDAKRVDGAYEDLDEQYAIDQLEGLLDELANDIRQGSSSKMQIRGDARRALSSYKTAVNKYREFRHSREMSDQTGDPRSRSETGETQLLGLERDMQSALRKAVGQLEPGLVIADGGTERSVASGFIDITAMDESGTIVVIELKTGTARRDAVGQILSYMGDVAADEPGRKVRGILVAGDFDSKARAAASIVPSLSLRRYKVAFHFKSAD